MILSRVAGIDLLHAPNCYPIVRLSETMLNMCLLKEGTQEKNIFVPFEFTHVLVF